MVQHLNTHRKTVNDNPKEMEPNEEGRYGIETEGSERGEKCHREFREGMKDESCSNSVFYREVILNQTNKKDESPLNFQHEKR